MPCLLYCRSHHFLIRMDNTMRIIVNIICMGVECSVPGTHNLPVNCAAKRHFLLLLISKFTPTATQVLTYSIVLDYENQTKFVNPCFFRRVPQEDVSCLVVKEEP